MSHEYSDTEVRLTAVEAAVKLGEQSARCGLAWSAKELVEAARTIEDYASPKEKQQEQGDVYISVHNTAAVEELFAPLSPWVERAIADLDGYVLTKRDKQQLIARIERAPLADGLPL